MAFAKEWVLRGMDTIENMLSKSKGKYCFGDQITCADLFFAPQVMGAAARFGVDLKNYKNVS
jgi:maleylacetoacetate isomerase